MLEDSPENVLFCHDTRKQIAVTPVVADHNKYGEIVQ